MPPILSRETLGLAPPRNPLSPIRRPVDRTYAHHTVTADYGTDYRRTAQLIQQVAFSRGFSDASYGAAIAKDGAILELRGFDWIGAHTTTDSGSSLNSVSNAIVFVGNYETDPVADVQVESFRFLVAMLRLGGYLTGGSRIDPHQAVKSTACPGRNVVARLDDLRSPWSPPATEPTFEEVPPMYVLRWPDGPTGTPPLLIGSTGRAVRRVHPQTVRALDAAGVPVVNLTADNGVPGDVAQSEYRRFAADLD